MKESPIIKILSKIFARHLISYREYHLRILTRIFFVKTKNNQFFTVQPLTENEQVVLQVYLGKLQVGNEDSVVLDRPKDEFALRKKVCE